MSLAGSRAEASAYGLSAEDLKYAWRVLSVSAIGAILAGINSSMIDVALPSVNRHFDSSATEASWILLSYLLVTTSLIMVFGRIADMVGRRRLYLLGLGLLTVASLLCGIAPSAGWLIALRAVQAIGAAALACNITALITDAFPPRLLSTALGLNVTIAATAAVSGPLVGGALVSAFGWSSIFWANVPVGAFGLVWAWLSLRADRPVAEREPFDFVGAVLSTVAISGIVLALSEGATQGWTSLPVIGAALVFVVGMPSFVILELHRRHPLLDPRLFADRERSLAYLALFLTSLARFALVLLIALYLQAAAGLSAFAAGLHVIYVPIGMAVASPIAGRLAQRYSARILSSLGLALVAGGIFGLCALISPSMSGVALGFCLAAVGVGSGLFFTPNTSSIMASVEPDRRGIANGVRQSLQNAGYVVSTALALALITKNLGAVDKKAAYAGTLSSLSPHALVGFTDGYRWALFVLGVVSVVGLVASLSRNPSPIGRET
ncbi:MAG: hypothetical protein JWM76_5262 [Pseudonocardiales bacterium]|nr:hypothetical protein [Pseudonocardiales bacterium]